jgi:hypothetical protein
MQHSQPYGEMAKAYCYRSLPLQVLQSAAGYYIGTADASGPVSRESTRYWNTRSDAENALLSGGWKQRVYP